MGAGQALPSKVSRVQRLTLLAPNIVEVILNGRQPAELQLDYLPDEFPLVVAATEIEDH